mmetsp:Transcript_49425/g.132253  ORF Transcript_49425/g.132253 Transcript_49425/m.132253 type:complete len:200 (+) Transcript_49425:1011-1610(+)
MGLELLERGVLGEPLVPIRPLLDAVGHGPSHRFEARVAVDGRVARFLRIARVTLLSLVRLLALIVVVLGVAVLGVAVLGAAVVGVAVVVAVVGSGVVLLAILDLALVLMAVPLLVFGLGGVARQRAHSAVDLVDDGLEGLEARPVGETEVPLGVRVDAVSNGPRYVHVAWLAGHRRVAVRALLFQHHGIAVRLEARSGG